MSLDVIRTQFGLTPWRGYRRHATRTQAIFVQIVAGKNVWQEDETRCPEVKPRTIDP